MMEFVRLINRDMQKLAEVLSAEHGKTVPDARGDIQRGVEEGLVRPDVDLHYAADLLVGPMAYRNLIRTDPPPGPELAAQIVDDVLVALAPKDAP